MRESASVNPDEIRHDAQSTRAKLSELSQEPELFGREDLTQALADLEVDLARVEAEVDRALPNDGIDEMLRLDIAELKDVLPHAEPSLGQELQAVVSRASYIERRMKALETERAAARLRSALRKAGTRVLVGVLVAAAPFVLGYARKRPLLASAHVLAGSAAAASAMLLPAA